MPPNFSSVPPSPRKRKLSVALLGVVPVVILGAVAYHALTFHIIKTDPSLSKVGNYSPFVRVYFSKPLNSGSVKVTDSGGIATTTTVNDKTITFNLRSGLRIGQRYSILLDHVASTSGDVIDHKSFSFVVKDIPVGDLSADQQAAIMNKQDKYPYSVHSIPFKGFDELTNSGGLSADQEQVVKQAIFDYSQSVNTKFTAVSLDATSITPGPFDPNSADPTRSVTFDITANGTPYHLDVSYEDLSNAKVLIHDVSGNIVFDNTTAIDDTTDSVEE